jgi:hypothetical protein
MLSCFLYWCFILLSNILPILDHGTYDIEQILMQNNDDKAENI